MRSIIIGLCVVTWMGCGSSDGGSGSTANNVEGIKANCVKGCLNQVALPCKSPGLDETTCETKCEATATQITGLCQSEYLATAKCQAGDGYYYCKGDQMASKAG